MIAPVKNYSKISTYFGATPDSGVFRKHAGLDYVCPVGTPIYAAISGRVTASFIGSEAGNQVEVTDGTYSVRTLYMNSRLVQEGRQVTEGQEIGLSGNSGDGSKSTGPHVHFDVRKAGTVWNHSFSDYFDPMKLINEGEEVAAATAQEIVYAYRAIEGAIYSPTDQPILDYVNSGKDLGTIQLEMLKHRESLNLDYPALYKRFLADEAKLASGSSSSPTVVVNGVTYAPSK